MKSNEILTLKEVAAFLKLSPLTVYRLSQRGKLPGVKIGSQWRYWRMNVEKMMRRPKHSRLVRPNHSGTAK